MNTTENQVATPSGYVSQYAITTLCPAPSMNVDKVPFEGTFADAVEVARASYAKTGRTTRVCCKHGLKSWFSITAKGEECTNTGAVYRHLDPVTLSPRAKYDAALEVFREASANYRRAVHAYRAREIGDAEYLAARRTFGQEQEAADVAEAEFIAASR